MSKLYFTANQLFEELLTIPVTDSSIVHIATYSMYIDVAKSQDWAKVYGPSKSRRLIDKTKDLKEFKLMVGAPYYMKELAHLREYIAFYNNKVKQLKIAVDHFKLNCRVHNSSHLKYYRIDDRVFIGGINLTASNWIDVAIEVFDKEQKEELAKIFAQAFEESEVDISLYFKTVEVRK